jgi:hypothetical protein
MVLVCDNNYSWYYHIQINPVIILGNKMRWPASKNTLASFPPFAAPAVATTPYFLIKYYVVGSMHLASGCLIPE